jgi:hypothetical protein
VVQNSVVRLRADQQVFVSVVEFVAVDMVNHFALLEASPKNFLSLPDVLKQVSA